MKCKEYMWYQNGVNYNNRLEPNYYDMVDCNWDFFYGKQWRGANLDADKPQPVFNEINRYATFFVASIMASKPSVDFSAPIQDEEDNSDAIVNAAWDEFAERVKLTYQAKNALYDGAVTGDYIGHMMFDPTAKPYGGTFSDVEGQIDFELVAGNNFYMANANSKDVQSQSYVQVVGRDLISNLKEEQEQVKEMYDEVEADNNTEEQASVYGQIEMEGEGTEKATYVITYQKKKNKEGEKTVHVTKCTEGAYIYKDIDTGCKLYPVALGNWELQRNTYHGMSFVSAVIPTQIFINRAFAAAMYHTLLETFPKFLYNKDKMGGISSRIGGQFAIKLNPGETLANVASFIAPGSMSPDVMNMISLAKQYMQEAVGANDALLGNVNPESASGVSIATASKQAGIPLENPRANLYNWYEDLARIFYDMASVMYGTRPVVVSDTDNAEIVEYDFSQLKNMYKSITVNVGPSSYWSELANIQTLDNLLERQLIELVDYYERMPEGVIKDKQGLINKLKEQVKGDEQMEQDFLQSMSPEEQQAFLQLPLEEQQSYMAQAKGVA